MVREEFTTLDWSGVPQAFGAEPLLRTALLGESPLPFPAAAAAAARDATRAAIVDAPDNIDAPIAPDDDDGDPACPPVGVGSRAEW